MPNFALTRKRCLKRSAPLSDEPERCINVESPTCATIRNASRRRCCLLHLPTRDERGAFGVSLLPPYRCLLPLSAGDERGDGLLLWRILRLPQYHGWTLMNRLQDKRDQSFRMGHVFRISRQMFRQEQFLLPSFHPEGTKTHEQSEETAHPAHQNCR